MNAASIMRRALVLLLAAGASGCISTKSQLDLEYRPESGAKSPLSTIQPLVLSIRIDDHRDNNERDRVGTRFKGGLLETPITANRDVILVLTDALTKELENNGHHVRLRKEANVDSGFHFRLKRYWCCDVRLLGSQLGSRHWAAMLNGDVEILNARNEHLLSKPISGTYVRAVDAQIAEYEPMLNGVLSEFIRSLARDPGIIDALRSVQRDRRVRGPPQ